jgi:hypothetical protein
LRSTANLVRLGGGDLVVTPSYERFKKFGTIDQISSSRRPIFSCHPVYFTGNCFAFVISLNAVIQNVLLSRYGAMEMVCLDLI